MARWGEGDPRWIVEERPDATNVNNWHWTEKNACGWSKEKLKELLVGLKMESDVFEVQLAEMEKLDGDASANNRKGKLIFFYEWDLCLVWRGKLKGGTGEHEGKITIPNLSEENEPSEVEVTVTLKESTSEGEAIKAYLHQEGSGIIRQALALYISTLKEEFSKGMILPKKDGEHNNHKEESTQMSNLSKGFKDKVQVQKDVPTPNNKGKPETTSLKLTQTFQCLGEDFYRALTVPELLSAFTNSNAIVDPTVGGQFQLFNGNIVGEFTELVPGKKIVQRWRLKSWPTGHFSLVSIVIDQQVDHTLVKISQTGIPESDVEGTKENWSRYYWDSIKRTFGWGYYM